MVPQDLYFILVGPEYKQTISQHKIKAFKEAELEVEYLKTHVGDH